MGLNAENALRGACRKFRARWAAMEDAALEAGEPLEKMDAQQREAL